MKNRSIALAFSCIAALAATATAHVTLLSPVGGEEYVEGGIAVVEWEVAIGHNTQAWSLYYSTVSNEGPFEDLAVGLPPGDITTGALHEYEWELPAELTAGTQVWVRVLQDNLGNDYDDISGKPALIVGAPCPADMNDDDRVDGADLSALLGDWGETESLADFDQSGLVDGADLAYLLGEWGDC